MNFAHGDALKLAVAIALSVVVYGTWARYRERVPSAVLRIVSQGRLHHVAVGIMVGYACSAGMRGMVDQGVLLVVAFLTTWYAMAFGISIDWRILPSVGGQWPKREALYLVVLLLVLAVLRFGVESGAALDAGYVLALGGVAAMSWPQMRWSEKKMRLAGKTWKMPSLGIAVGIVLLGYAGLQLRAGMPIALSQPFANPLLLEGAWSRLLCSLGIGAAMGILIDLATRGVRRHYFPHIVAGGVMCGGGIGAGIALESVWIGVCIGIWLINTTLHRVSALQLVEESADPLGVGLSVVAGLLLGLQWASVGIHTALFWFALLLLVGLPAIRLVGGRMAGEPWGGGASGRSPFSFGDMGLVAALSLNLSAGAPAAAGLVAAWVVCQAVYALVGERLSDIVSRPIRRRPAPSR